MNLSPDIIFYGLVTISLTVLSGIVGLLVYQARALRANSKKIHALSAHLEVFTETSIHVSRSVDRFLRDPERGGEVKQASRRWVVQEAMQRLETSGDIEGVAEALGLSVDEQCLLQVRRG